MVFTNTPFSIVHKQQTPCISLFTNTQHPFSLPSTPLRCVHKHPAPLFIVFTNTQHPSSLCSQALNTLLSCIQLNAVHKHQTTLCCLQTSNTALGCLLYCCCCFLPHRQKNNILCVVSKDSTPLILLFTNTQHNSYFYLQIHKTFDQKYSATVIH